MKHLLTMSDLSKSDISNILRKAKQFDLKNSMMNFKKYYIANLFFESSTRTKVSFEMAERRLGMQIISFDVGASSVNKGESLYDTVKTLESIGIDAVVIRHPEDRYFESWLDDVNISVINGGDGCGNHPSQCLLDLFTIQEEFGDFTGLKVVIAGDLRHSRVARSNAEALTKLHAEVYFSGPKEWMEENDLYEYRHIDMDEAVKIADVMMLLRIQHERHDQSVTLSGSDYLAKYGLTIEREKKMKTKSIIMHPAPVNRNVEMADELVECDRSRIFKQMKNGVPVRMAILDYVLNKKEE